MRQLRPQLQERNKIRRRSRRGRLRPLHHCHNHRSGTPSNSSSRTCIQCLESVGGKAETVAYAAHCQQETGLDRPVAGKHAVVQYETQLRPHKHLPKINLYCWPHCPLPYFNIEGNIDSLQRLTFIFHSMSSFMHSASLPASLPSSETLWADQELPGTKMDGLQ